MDDLAPASVAPLTEEEAQRVQQVEPFHLRPCDLAPPMEIQEQLERVNAYFTRCAARGKRPLLTEAALAGGWSGPTEMRRAALRHPELRRPLAQIFTSIASFYEAMIGISSAAGPLFMLKNIPDYDALDEGAPPQQVFQDRLIVEERVVGAKTRYDTEEDLSPRAAYLKYIKGDLIEDAKYEVVPVQRRTVGDRVEEIIGNKN